jgi:hypothetical protein
VYFFFQFHPSILDFFLLYFIISFDFISIELYVGLMDIIFFFLVSTLDLLEVELHNFFVCFLQIYPDLIIQIIGLTG